MNRIQRTIAIIFAITILWVGFGVVSESPFAGIIGIVISAVLFIASFSGIQNIKNEKLKFKLIVFKKQLKKIILFAISILLLIGIVIGIINSIRFIKEQIHKPKIFTQARNFKSPLLERLSVFSDELLSKIKIVDDKDHLLYAVVSKNPVSRNGVLLTVLKISQTYTMGRGDMTPTDVGHIEEFTYIYDELVGSILSVKLKVEETEEKDENGLANVKEVINTTLQVSLNKEGTLALSYVDQYGNHIDLSRDYYISFSLIAPDRILVQVKNK